MTPAGSFAILHTGNTGVKNSCVKKVNFIETIKVEGRGWNPDRQSSRTKILAQSLYDQEFGLLRALEAITTVTVQNNNTHKTHFDVISNKQHLMQ